MFGKAEEKNIQRKCWTVISSSASFKRILQKKSYKGFECSNNIKNLKRRLGVSGEYNTGLLLRLVMFAFNITRCAQELLNCPHRLL